MKVLFLTGDLKPYRIPLMNSLVKEKDIELSVAHSGKPKKLQNYQWEEIILRENSFGPFSIHVDNLYKLCENYDVVIAMFYLQKLSILRLINRKQKSFKLLLWGHGVGRSKIMNMARLFLSRSADGLISYNKKGKVNLINLGVEKTKLFIANNTLNVTNAKDYSDANKKYFLYLGRLQRRKELDVFIDAFKMCMANFDKPVRILIVGSGDKEKAFLINYLSKNNVLEFCEFKEGSYQDDVISEYFKYAYAYVSPGPVGLGVLHSFAYGVPVITLINRKHGPEAENIINNENSLYASSVKDFSDKLLACVNEEIYKPLGKRAFEYYISRRTINIMKGELVSVIRSVC